MPTIRSAIGESFTQTAGDTALWPSVLERQLENVRPGAHICSIYTTQSNRLRVLGAFFGGGLRHGAQCVYFADPDSADDVARALQALGGPLQARMEHGAWVVVSSRAEYLRNGHFQPRAMFELQDAMIRRARRSGFSAVRIACAMSWVLGSDITTQRRLEYESKLNSTLGASDRSIVCHYDVPQSQPPVIRDVLRTHPVALSGERVHDNPYYEPLDPPAAAGSAEPGHTDWMVRRLEGLTRRHIALFDLGRLTQEGTSTDDPMRAAPDLIAAGMQLDCVQLFELLPLGDAVQLIGANGLDRAAIGTVEPLAADSVLADPALREGEPLSIDDWQAETKLRLPAILAEPASGVTSGASIVIGIGRGERLYGFLSGHFRQAHIFSDDELLFLEAVAHLLASAFAAARAVASFRALVENTPDVIVRFSGDLRVIYANPAIERVTATSAESLIGKTSSALGILKPLLGSWELLLGQVWRTGREQAFELAVPTPMGERVFSSRIVPEPGPDGSAQSVLTIMHDVTDQRRAEAERSALYQQLVAQQNQVQELMGRFTPDPGRTPQRIAPASDLDHLTERERHILRLLAAGWTNREIGAELKLTVGTVKNQVARILSKLNVSDRTQAAVRAVQLGLVDSNAQEVAESQ